MNKEKIEKLFDLRKGLEEKLRALDEAETEELVSQIGEEIATLKADIAALEEELYSDPKEEEEKPAAEDPKEEEKPAAEDPKEDEENLEEVKRSFNPLKSFNLRKGEVKMENTKIEERAKALKETNKMIIENEEARSVLVSSGKLATPTGVSGINDEFATVSSIVDLVKVVNCEGMGSNKVAYVDEEATAAKQVEGSAAGASDPVFGFVTITPENVAVLSSISKQAKKQSPLQYEAKVRESAMVALRKMAANIITTKALASALNGTVNDITAIDDKTLRKIALSYGGDEGVYGETYLFLNKKDLIKFGDVRGTSNKNAVYEIIPDTNPNTGVIKDGGLTVKYCLNSNLTENTMLYGNPKNIELDLFSNYEIAVSSDFYFDKLMDAVRGDVELGADVVAKNGLLKITVGA